MSINNVNDIAQNTTCVAGEHLNETFDWSQGNTSRTFPIDYSMREFGALIDRDFHTMGKRLIDHFLLKEELYRHVSKEDQETAHPLPVEARTFLSCAYEMLGVPGSKYYKKFTKKEELNNQEFSDFVHDLCRNLYTVTFCPDKYDGISHIAQDSTLFTQHALFCSNTFNNELLQQLWHEEFIVRIERLRKVLSQKEPATQMQALLQCLCYIDRYIYEIGPQNSSIKGKETASDKNPVQEMLDQLLASRRKMYIDAMGEYRINNITIPGDSADADSKTDNYTMSLETAFTKLQDFKHPKKDLMQRTRNGYLQWLEQEFDISETEKTYLQLKAYLDYTADPEQIENLVIKIMKHICIEKIDQCTYLVCEEPTDASGPSSESKECTETCQVEAFVAWIARNQIESVLQIFGDILSMVDKYSAMSYAYEKVFQVESFVSKLQKELPVTPIVASQENTYALAFKYDVEAFWGYFQRAWKFLYAEDLDLATETSAISDIASAFTERGTRAAKFFERDSLFKFTVEEIEQMLKLCKEVSRLRNTDLVSKIEVPRAIVAILTGLLLQTLEYAINDKKAVIISKLQWMFALQ